MSQKRGAVESRGAGVCRCGSSRERDADGGSVGRGAPFETRKGRRRRRTARDGVRCTRLGCHATTTHERRDTARRPRSCRGYGLGAGGIPLSRKASREAFAPRLGDYSPRGVEDGVAFRGLFEPSAERSGRSPRRKRDPFERERRKCPAGYHHRPWRAVFKYSRSAFDEWRRFAERAERRGHDRNDSGDARVRVHFPHEGFRFRCIRGGFHKASVPRCAQASLFSGGCRDILLEISRCARRVELGSFPREGTARQECAVQARGPGRGSRGACTLAVISVGLGRRRRHEQRNRGGRRAKKVWARDDDDGFYAERLRLRRVRQRNRRSRL
mmetsp:Transcript_14614/g.61658  ORF Transcript_14614/g.61658 Transcript_14614/m.61658 type:complete len:328 (+) Transcript_14614:660-1643(+)